MEVHICQSLIVRAASRSKEIRPEHRPVQPTWPQIRDGFDSNPIYFGSCQPRYRRTDRGRHTENEIRGPRHRTTDAPSFHENFLSQRSCLFGREPRRIVPRHSDGNGSSNRLRPPFGPLEVQVQEQDGRRGCSLQDTRIRTSPPSQVDCGIVYERVVQLGFYLTQQGNTRLIQPPHHLQVSHARPLAAWQLGRCAAAVVLSHPPIQIHQIGSALSDAHGQCCARVSLHFPRNASPTICFGRTNDHNPEKSWRRTQSRTTPSPANFDVQN